jgi:hypothetical protein
MNAAAQKPTDGEDKGCTGCNLEEIEQLACKAKRFGQQAKVMDEVSADLQKYRDEYAGARQAYTDARAAAEADLESIRRILDDLWDQLRCRLTDDQKECMKDASDEVFDDITECSDPPGCHSPCDDTEGSDPETQTDIAALAAEIARRRANLAESAAYFTALVAEPDTIKQQMASRKADAEALEKDVSAGSDSSKVPSLYARWLILDYWADFTRTGHGFGSVTEYLDCLCTVLKCLVSGWTLVAVLEGRKAELECHETARQEACKKKKEDTLHVILERYAECCRGKGGDESTTQGDESPKQGGESPTQGGDSPAQSGKAN